MDNTTLEERLQAGAGALGLEFSDEAAARLVWLLLEVLRWNRKVNLTAISDPLEGVEKHLLDSLAILPELEGVRSLLDIGAGAGFPGLPAKLVRPDLELTLLEASAKKVGFLKHALAQLRLEGARAVQGRAKGEPEAERVPRCEAVVSRALAEPSAWLPLAAPYALPNGRVLTMLGRAPPKSELAQLGRAASLALVSLRGYRLPFSGAERAVARFDRPA
ncbi:MAG: 16S rRNA (guanine(527)-N(7))-methyltransferase RsmG [Myxococcales bacterium]|nr:16S rRNA (guanine(527)-N(7))-methyltransferase RsmG [Myxococcales bacterium]